MENVMITLREKFLPLHRTIAPKKRNNSGEYKT